MRAPCSNTRANTKSRRTASHRVNEKPQLILSGTATDDTLAAKGALGLGYSDHISPLGA